jgi:molybdate transport system substrate-binding protein
MMLLTMTILALGASQMAHAQAAQTEVTLTAPGGIRAAIEEMVPAFEKNTGFKVKPTFGSGLGTKKQVVDGVPFDVPVIQPPLTDVIKSGNVVLHSDIPLASVSVGLAVKHGAPHPAVLTTEGVKKLLLAAKSISFPDPAGGAGAGVSFEQTLKKLGIAKQVESKLIRSKGGAAAMEAVAKGEAEIGFTYMSEMDVPGIDPVGPLPANISPPTQLIGFLSAHSKNPAAAKALLKYLSSPEAAPVYKAHKMEPGRPGGSSL